MTRIIKLQPDYLNGKSENTSKVSLKENRLSKQGFYPAKLIHVAVSDGKLVITSVE